MKVRRVDYYPDEYVVGVCRMGFEHQGVYWMICSLIMSSGGPIENDPKWIGNLGGMGSAKCRNIISDLVRCGKLTENCGKISQKRAENELRNAQKRIDTAAENGKKGGRPPSNNKGMGEPAGLSGEKLTTNYQLPTITEEKKDSPIGESKESPAAQGPPPVGSADPADPIDPVTLVDEPKPPPKPSKPPARGTLIDPDWRPTDADRDYARDEHHMPDHAIEAEAGKFRDFWASKSGADARKRDWSATWRNWIRRAAERPYWSANGHAHQGNGRAGEHRAAEQTGVFAVAARVAARKAGLA